MLWLNTVHCHISVTRWSPEWIPLVLYRCGSTMECIRRMLQLKSYVITRSSVWPHLWVYLVKCFIRVWPSPCLETQWTLRFTESSSWKLKSPVSSWLLIKELSVAATILCRRQQVTNQRKSHLGLASFDWACSVFRIYKYLIFMINLFHTWSFLETNFTKSNQFLVALMSL